MSAVQENEAMEEIPFNGDPTFCLLKLCQWKSTIILIQYRSLQDGDVKVWLHLLRSDEVVYPVVAMLLVHW